MDAAPGAATAPDRAGLQSPPSRLAFMWTRLSPASEQLPTVPTTDPISSVKMLLGSAAAQGSGNKAWYVRTAPQQRLLRLSKT